MTAAEKERLAKLEESVKMLFNLTNQIVSTQRTAGGLLTSHTELLKFLTDDHELVKT